ncbi:MAG: ATP-binding protein [Bacteroidetes bacterium]|nr:ATP-binding protein [Bacteroidota bacterium]
MKEYFESIRKFNFWNQQIPNLGFIRTDYTDKIMSYVGNKLVKVLVGQRRSGKSYLLRQIANQLITNGVDPKNIFYINKEFIELDFVKTYKDLENLLIYYKDELNPIGKKYLFIDEIQNIEGWERFVNSHAQDFVEQYEIFISGSNSKLLSGELSTLLSGRYVQFEIFTFSFQEYFQFLNIENSKQSYIEYLETGGLPELFSLPNHETKRNYISALKDSVLLRDIIQRYNIKDPKLLEDLFIFLVNNASNLISINSIINYYKGLNKKTTYDTLSNYIHYIEETFLIHKAERYNIRGKDLIAGNCKYYINDLAYKNLLYPGVGYGIGYKLENIIFLELRRAGFEVYVGVEKGKEVDFVAIKGDRKIYFQVAYLIPDESTMEREYNSLETIKDHYEKYLVSLDDFQFSSRNGIQHIQAWNLKF